MRPKHALGATCAACALAVPAAAAADGGDDRLRPRLASELSAPSGPAAQLRRATHKRVVARHLRVTRRHARLQGERPPREVPADALRTPTVELARENRRLRRQVRSLRKRLAERERRRAARARRVAVPAALQAIAACESGGDPSAVSAGGQYRGKYQFDRATWAGVGGSGDPAAAPEGEQDRRAAMLYARAGATPWPVCGR